MRSAFVFILAVMVSAAFAVEVGTPVLAMGTYPFGSCGDQVHSQTLVYADEINTAITIESISFRIYGPSPIAYSDGLEMYIGLSDNEELSETFESNILPGTRTLVFNTDSLYIGGAPGEMLEIEFETPYYYSGEHNLIVDMVSDYNNYIIVYGWESGVQKGLVSYSLSSTLGQLFTKLPYMVLEGTLDLQPSTVGSIKIEFGAPER